MPAARLVGMSSVSANSTIRPMKVKKNLFLRECAQNDNQYDIQIKRSKLFNGESKSISQNDHSKRSKPPVNIVVINGSWMPQEMSFNSNSNSPSGDVDDLGVHMPSMDNEENPWTFQNNYSDGDLNETFNRSRRFSQEASYGDDTGFSEDSNSSLCCYSSHPVQSIDARSEDDRDTENLGWLLNFNVHSLVNPGVTKYNHNQPINSTPSTSVEDINMMRATISTPISYQGNDQVGLCSSDSKSNTKKFQQGLNVPKSTSKVSQGGSKPPFTYSELIEKALTEAAELTVSELYHWISYNFPFYQPNDDRWKNSVRHNLSINPHFRKGRKSTQGAGHLWSLAPSYVKKDGADLEAKARKVAAAEAASEAAAAKDIHIVTLQEVEAATASIEEDKENRQLPLSDVYYFDSSCYDALDTKENEEFSITILGTSQDRGLVQSAEEILNGVKKNVEVQYVMPDQECEMEVVHRNGSEFLNPVSMQEIVAECGLSYQLGDTGIGADGTSFMITEINPETLGINIVETITPDLFADHTHIDIG